jgi:hypothetical protein
MGSSSNGIPDDFVNALIRTGEHAIPIGTSSMPAIRLDAMHPGKTKKSEQ